MNPGPCDSKAHSGLVRDGAGLRGSVGFRRKHCRLIVSGMQWAKDTRRITAVNDKKKKKRFLGK